MGELLRSGGTTCTDRSVSYADVSEETCHCHQSGAWKRFRMCRGGVKKGLLLRIAAGQSLRADEGVPGQRRGDRQPNGIGIGPQQQTPWTSARASIRAAW
nr:hypothetical protein GCM10025730_53200 [Promicromonospora thailandica]